MTTAGDVTAAAMVTDPRKQIEKINDSLTRFISNCE